MACQDDSRPRDKKLGQLLVRGGFISEEECAHALALQDTKGRRLGELIVAQGLLELVTVRSLAEVQVFETVFEVFSWREGEYEFRNEGLVNGQTGLRLLGEEVLLEGVRYLDEMPALKSLYPDREATLKARRHGVSHGMLEELSPGASCLGTHRRWRGGACHGSDQGAFAHSRWAKGGLGARKCGPSQYSLECCNQPRACKRLRFVLGASLARLEPWWRSWAWRTFWTE